MRQEPRGTIPGASLERPAFTSTWLLGSLPPFVWLPCLFRFQWLPCPHSVYPFFSSVLLILIPQNSDSLPQGFSHFHDLPTSADHVILSTFLRPHCQEWVGSIQAEQGPAGNEQLNTLAENGVGGPDLQSHHR